MPTVQHSQHLPSYMSTQSSCQQSSTHTTYPHRWALSLHANSPSLATLTLIHEHSVFIPTVQHSQHSYTEQLDFMPTVQHIWLWKGCVSCMIICHSWRTQIAWKATENMLMACQLKYVWSVDRNLLHSIDSDDYLHCILEMSHNYMSFML